MQQRQKIIIGITCVPILYCVHLFLLQTYASILSGPGYEQYLPSRAPSGERPFTPADCPLIDLDEFRPPSLQASGEARFPVPTEAERKSDVSDTFAGYKYAEDCGLSSLDIHMPFTPLCRDKRSLLTAMSGGGRAGYEKPYIPLGCDMRWYSAGQACKILSKFSHVAFIGDSLLRHVVNALYVILRQDMGYGGMTDWNLDFTEAEDIKTKEDCKCSAQTGKHVCSDGVISHTSWLTNNVTLGSESSPLSCSPADNVDVSFTRSNAHEATKEELYQITAALPTPRFDAPNKPLAFIMHSTFWNNVNVTATTLWVKEISRYLNASVPGAEMSRLFVTANAGGLSKSARYMEAQGNQQLGNFEKEITPKLEDVGVDVLGFFNMSIQSLTSDGTHASFGANLLKAQMVLNWLDNLDT